MFCEDPYFDNGYFDYGYFDDGYFDDGYCDEEYFDDEYFDDGYFQPQVIIEQQPPIEIHHIYSNTNCANKGLKCNAQCYCLTYAILSVLVTASLAGFFYYLYKQSLVPAKEFKDINQLLKEGTFTNFSIETNIIK